MEQVDATGDFCDKRWSYAGPGCLVGKDAMNHYSQVYDFVVEATPLESLPFVANCALVDSVPDINNNVDVLQVKASDGSWDGSFSITSHGESGASERASEHERARARRLAAWGCGGWGRQGGGQETWGAGREALS